MRTVVGLLVLCPLLAGCSLFRDKRGGDSSVRGNSPPGSRPFTGLPPAAPQPEKTDRPDTASPASYSGVLAGSVRDSFNRKMTNGFIQVVDLNDPAKTKIDVAFREGEFVIPRLTPGHQYQLIARAQDGTRLLAGYYQTAPPNPKIAIVVSEDFVTPDTPPLPGPPTLPGPKPPEPAEKEKEKKPGPAAELGPPVKPKEETPPPDTRGTGSTGAPVLPPPTPPPDRTNIVDGGFTRIPPAPKIEVPGAGRVDPVPPPPRLPAPRDDERVPIGPPPAPKPEATPPTPRSALDPPPGQPAPVPSCVLVGKKLDNFALYGLDGKPWEFRKDRKGQLVLLHFWSSTDGDSLAGLKNLRDWQAKYESYGLQVVGIAYEQGAFAQQVQNVLSARGRYTLNYVTLLGGGGQGPCPVRDQFLVDRLPELVLIAEDGQIVWRSRGAPDADKKWELNREITRRLRINEP